MKLYKVLLLAFIVCLSCDNSGNSEIITDDTELPIVPEWSINIGSDTTIPFFPDGKSNYFTYSFSRAQNEEFIIRLNGIFPNARYFSVVLYDINTRDPLVIINDTEIIAASNNINPYDNEEYINGQQYSINIGPNSLDLGNFENSISYDPTLTDISIFIRYYNPLNDDFGGVDLPQISVVDINNNGLSAPEQLDLSDVILVGNVVADLTFLGTIVFDIESNTSSRQFFRVSAESTGNFANPDNQYLISPSNLGDDDVILLRWKASSVAENFNNFETSNMRYYSMSLSNEASYNFKTISDSELYVATDGYINLVVAKNDAEIIEQAQGLNYIEWPEGLGDEGYLLYRNLLTKEDFEYNINLCPTLSGNFLDFIEQPETYEASLFIEEFAPQGIKMTKTEFLADFGGVNVSY